MTDEKHKGLRVWWMPQVPGTPFYVPVKSPEQAYFLLNTLAGYDLFQYEHEIKPDFSNAGGLEVKIDGEWEEWEDEYGDYVDEHFENKEPDISVKPSIWGDISEEGKMAEAFLTKHYGTPLPFIQAELANLFLQMKMKSK